MTSYRPTAAEKSDTQPVNPLAWRTVTDAKVVYVPLGEKPTKDGEMRMTFARTGIRVEMADFSWWFFHFKSSTWRRHYKLPGNPVEQKDKGLSESALKREKWPGPALVAALESGYDLALTAEAEKRAAGRAA